MKKICVITSSRADYGLLKHLLKEIKVSPLLDLQLIVCGSHLSSFHGMTINEIIDDGFKIDEKVDITQKNDTQLDISISISSGIKSFSRIYASLNPDAVLILGDRYEILAAAISATIANIPVVHLHGGEITEGAIDDMFRHSITKMSHLHFVAAVPYKKRVIQLGENPKNVFCVGGLGVDALNKVPILSKENLSKQLNIKLKKRSFLVTYHPLTANPSAGFLELLELLQALEKYEDCSIIFTMPNADADGLQLAKTLKTFADAHINTYYFSSLGQEKYFSCLSNFDAVIGNSSSGLLEAPSFKIPTINIGDRQKGRLKAESIIDCEAKKENIQEAIQKALSPKFIKKIQKTNNPYGRGGASKKIVRILENSDFSKLFIKEFFDQHAN